MASASSLDEALVNRAELASAKEEIAALRTSARIDGDIEVTVVEQVAAWLDALGPVGRGFAKDVRSGAWRKP